MEQQNRITKYINAVALVIVIVFTVWLAVQVVKVLPTAFESLASLAESIYNYKDQEELIVTTENQTVSDSKPFLISWNEISETGLYTFSYECAEGVSVTITESTNTETVVTCGETVTLGDNITELEIMVESERSRFTDIEYEIAFVPYLENEPLVTAKNTITVVNASIPSELAYDDEETMEESDAESAADIGSEDTETLETAEVDTTPAIPSPTYIYTTPVSNPLGYVDLRAQFIGVGKITNDGRFEARQNLDEDDRPAFQFVVVNEGTKTSDDWSFEAELTSGMEFESPTQDPLEPKERAIMTLEYGNTGASGVQKIKINVDTDEDVSRANNAFSTNVTVLD